MRDPAWWEPEGLRFGCVRCGACCRGSGYVWLTDEEIARLCRHLGIAPRAFMKLYVRGVGGRLSLVDSRSGDCVFYEAGGGCTVYESRPDQCRSWPFWERNLETPKAWEAVREVCPGTRSGEVFPAERIRAILDERADTNATAAEPTLRCEPNNAKERPDSEHRGTNNGCP